MDQGDYNLPRWLLWSSSIASILGFVAAVIAAWRAKGAREQATLAKIAATRLGRIAQLSDVMEDMKELQVMLARADFLAIAAKGQHLRGRIVRFKAEAYSELSESEKESLDAAREQLEAIAKVAATGKGTDESRLGRIQIGYGHANEALNNVFGLQRPRVEGESPLP